MSTTTPFNRASVTVEYEHASREFHSLLATSSRVDLKAPSSGTRWTNEELLFHMLFGYMILWALLGLVRFVSRLPAPVGRGFARVLNVFTRPFDIVNYWGSRWGGIVFNRGRMGSKWDRAISSLLQRLDRETELNLKRGMPYPTRWDPFFTDFMTLGDLYHYPTQHFWFHHRQLSRATGAASSDPR